MAVEIRVRSTVVESVPNLNQLQKRAQRLLDALGLTKAELSILLTADSEITSLNRRFRGIDSPTDALSFPMSDAGIHHPDWDGLLGDVVISIETAERQSHDDVHRERLGHPGPWTLADETLFLLIHGVLHLIGHDHDSDEDAARMEAEERRLFDLVGGR